MIRLLLSIADEIDELAAVEQAVDPKRAQFAHGMRHAAKVVRKIAQDQKREVPNGSA